MADKEIQKFRDDILGHLTEVREHCPDLSGEYDKQQLLYSKYATIYEAATQSYKYSGPSFAVDKMKELFPESKDIKILDYGCGTGTFADILVKDGYLNIDGLDPCREMLDEARRKNLMINFFQIGSRDDHSIIPSNTYDVVCSSGVFFASPSHPGFECLEELCRITKPGGYIVASLGNHYLECKSADFKVVEDLQNEGKLEILPKEVLPGYREAYVTEHLNTVDAAILTYKVL